MKICILTLGCKVNQYESDSLAKSLIELGHEVFSSLEKADVYIVNTCAVTNEAERKSRQTIAKIKKMNPKAEIVVCGCASQHNANKFYDMPGVQYVSGVANKMQIVKKICNLSEKIENIEDLPLIYEDNLIAKKTKTRAFIKIQDGCNNFCSYCLIPYLRGRSRSRSLESILKEIDLLGDSAKEIVLTGIDISSFQVDGKLGLLILLDKLKDYPFRVRLGSLEQAVIGEEFINNLAKYKNLCPHFHLSLQSGSDSVLKRMNRHYNSLQFENTVNSIRKVFPNAGITTDVIVGFPEETDEEFQQSYDFIKKIGFSHVHVFPYSKRDGTVAAKYPQVDGTIKKSRVAKLEELNKELNTNFVNENKGKILSVLIEEKVGEFFVGYSENYIKCYIKSENLLPNTFVNVKLTNSYKDGALAEEVN